MLLGSFAGGPFFPFGIEAIPSEGSGFIISNILRTITSFIVYELISYSFAAFG